MSPPRTIKSFWWSPDQPATRWFGILTLELDDTPSLELFLERTVPIQPLPPVGSVIHGMDEHGKLITLLFTGSGHQSISGGVATRTISAGYALIGISLPNADSFVAHSLRFSLQHFYGWLGRSGYGTTNDTAATFTVQYRQPEDETYNITPDLDLSIHSTYSAKNGFQERSIKEDAAMTFRSKSGLSLACCQKLVGSMRILLHFAVLKRIYPTWMTAYQDGHGYEAAGRWIDQDIEIVSSILHETKSEYLLADRWLFRFEDVHQNFAGFIRDWLAYEEKFSEALGCYASTVYHTFPSEMTLLTLTQALDAYHGIKYQSHQVNDFRQKIQEILNNHAEALRGLVDNLPDFVDRVHATRNYYTHHNPKWDVDGKVARRSDLIRMNEKLRLVFQMCVLTDLQIPKERFGRLRRQIASQIIEYL
jgi:hypothetical protein